MTTRLDLTHVVIGIVVLLILFTGEPDLMDAIISRMMG